MADEAPAGASSRPGPLSVVWHALASPPALLLLLGLLVVTLVTAGLVPQIPLPARDNQLQWVAAQPGIVASSWIRSLRLYDLAHSLWVRILLALLGAVLLIRLSQAVEIARLALVPRRWKPTHVWLWSQAHREEWGSALAPAEAIQEVEQTRSKHGYRWSPVTDGPVSTRAASRRAWALWFVPASYMGLLIALAGTLLLINYGWQSEQWQPSLGESHAVDAGGATTVRMEGFELERDSSDKVVSATTHFSWYAGEQKLSSSSVTTGHPAVMRGLAVRQLGYVPVLSIRGRDEEGRPLQLQEDSGLGLPRDVIVVFPSPESHPVLFLEKLDRLLVLSFEAADRTGKPAIRLALTTSTGAQQSLVGTLYESGEVSVDGTRLQVDLAFRPLLQADRLPGVALVVAGAMLALLALAAVWVVGPRLAWLSAAAEPAGGTRIRVSWFPRQREAKGASAHPEETRRAGRGPAGGRILNIPHCALQAAFLAMGTGVTSAAAWAWRTTGSLSGQAMSASWTLGGVLLAAMSLLAWTLGDHGPRWAAILAVLSAAAVVTGVVM